MSAADGIVWVYPTGPKCRVGVLKGVERELSNIEKRLALRITQVMRKVSETRGIGLPKEMYNSEGRWRVNGREIQVYAVKAPSVRVYGAVVTLEGIPSWVGTEADTDKKQNKADQERLKRAARKLAELEE